MSREWLALYCGILNKPKYRRLSPAGRGALLHLWALAGAQNPEATWDSRAELLDAFELEGFEAGNVDELIALRWLDLELDGTLTVHDWDVHQLAASKAIQTAYEAARKRTWRRTKIAPLPPTPSNPDTTGHDTTGQYIGPGHVPDKSRTGAVFPKDYDPPAKDADDHAAEAYLATICRRCHQPGNDSNPVVQGRHRFADCRVAVGVPA
jgi:hypothetical protein